MNWYKRIVAQDITAYLESLGADPTIIQFITSQEPSTSQLLTNEFRKNPGSTVEQLQQIQFPQKMNPYTDREINYANRYPEMSKWILYSLKGLRKGIQPWPPQDPGGEADFDMRNNYEIFYGKIPEIKDWYNSIKPDLTPYSPEQAIAASDEWHRAMAGKGEGKEYEPTIPQLTIYGPEWKNPEWNGWTIQKVISENDLLAEGNKMDHCVGDYCDRVKEGFSIIYSLRDPENNPHITLETNDFHDVTQIQGKSNSIPKPEYRAMIKEWITSDKNTNVENYSDDDSPFDEISTAYGTAEEILEAIERTVNDDYGLRREVDTDGVDVMNMAIEIMGRANQPSYWGDFQQIPEASIDMILQMPHASSEWKADKIKELEQELYKKEEENWDWATSHWDMSYFERPDEEDYATPAEFEAAEEKVMEEESDYMNEELRKTPSGGYAFDGLAYINELRKQGLIPEYEMKLPSVVGKGGNWYKKAYKEDIPVEGDPEIGGGEGQLSFTVEEPNSERTMMQHGKEALEFTDGPIEKYNGEYGSFRYLYRENNQIIGAVQGVYKNDKTILSNMYVIPERRGQGFGTQLISIIEKYEEDIVLSRFFSEEGAKFFGVR